MPLLNKQDGNSTKRSPMVWYVIAWYYIGIYVAELFWFLCPSLAKTFAKPENIDLKAWCSGKKRKCCIFWWWWKAGCDEVYQRKLVPSRVTPAPFSTGKCSASTSGWLEVMNPALLWHWTSANIIRHWGSEKMKHHYFCLLPGSGKVMGIAAKICLKYINFRKNWETQKHKKNCF